MKINYKIDFHNFFFLYGKVIKKIQLFDINKKYITI